MTINVAWFILLIASTELAFGQEDSLRSALNAIDRRQRDLSDYDDGEYGYPLERPEDLAFLKAAAAYPERSYDRANAVGRPLVNYLDKYDSDDANSRISSPFRERVEEDNQKQLEEVAKNLLANMENRPRYGLDSGENYEELLKQLWEKYRRPYDDSNAYSPNVDKRYYYPKFGLDAIGLRKRRYNGDDSENMYAHQHIPRDDVFDGGDDEDAQMNYLRNRYFQRENKLNKMRQMYGNPYSQLKHFPVAKRSSGYMPPEQIHEQKRSSIRKQTDPKVEKDLSDIFGAKSANKETAVSTRKPDATSTAKPSTSAKPTETPKEITGEKVKPPQQEDEKKLSASNNKEIFSPVPDVSEKPLQIKKKSIDWSDYFGLDRRKKAEPNDLDKEWLIERYHKSVAMSAKKKSAEIPLSSFRNHDEPSKKEFSDGVTEEKDKLSPEEQKIGDMDAKLKVMEDEIVDDALKYTGAHEGETDPKEIQEVKDKVISRLAAAYSLEKMRNALGEYKLAVAKERERLKNSRPDDDDYNFSEEKRTSVPRKQVVDKDRENILEADNNIKCTEGDENCHEQNYKTPSDTLENHFGSRECPAIQAACNDIASIVGEYGHVFRSACNMHEMCLLCSNNNWFSPTRQCNALFLAKAYDLCKGNLECQREAQRSVRYLLDVSRSLHSQVSAVDECEISCPESDMVSSSNRR